MALRAWSRFLKVAVLGDVAVVELWDFVLAESYEAWLFALAKDMPGKQIHLDCDEVTSFSSEVLGTLVGLQKRVKDAGGRLRLFNVSPDLYEVLAASRLDRLFDAKVREAD
jgi:anti-anti-sigma factor